MTALAVGQPATSQVVQLLGNETHWKFNQTNDCYGTQPNWTQRTLPEAAWGSGPAPLGFNDSPEVLLTIRTLLHPPTDLAPPGHVVYVRGHFPWGANRFGLLTLSNQVNDGAVFHVNGMEMHRVRVDPGPHTHRTLASAVANPGQADTFTFFATNLINGDNVLAVSVHQSATNSRDIFFIVDVRGEEVQPVWITQQPAKASVEVGYPATFSVVASGSLLTYQWQFNLVNIDGATNADISIPQVRDVDAGGYRCIITNPVNSATSQIATLTVLPDSTPPRLVSAVAQEATAPPFYILVRFDERLGPASATVRTNYVITELGSTSQLVVSNAQLNANLVRLTVSPWQTDAHYILTVNNVTDQIGNPIAPNSRIGIAFWRPLIPLNARWSWCEDFDLTGQDWTSASYDESTNEWFSGGQWVIPNPIWDPVGRAVFYFPVLSSYRFSGTGNTVLTFGRTCYYFRHRFTVCPDLSPVGTLRLNHVTDDGAVFYLNGVEVLRYNMPDGPIAYSTLASAQRGTFAGTETEDVVVTNLVGGDNVLAVELHPASTLPFGETGIAFGLALDGAIAPLPPPELSPPLPRLEIARLSDRWVVVSWRASTCLLQSKSALDGDWSDLPEATSPFTNAVTETRFFRLLCP